MDECIGPTRKRRRGTQQRATTQRIDAEVESTLATLLLYNIVWGIFSPQQCQDIAKCATNDIQKVKETPNCRLPKLEKLAAAGTDGTHKNNVYRDVMSSVKYESQLPKL